MDHDAVLSVLLEWNPWLESNSVPEELVGIPRNYDVTAYLQIPEIKILEGVRRSGKSTLLYQIAKAGLKTNKRVLYVNFDDEILKGYTLEQIYNRFLQYSEVDYLLVDEVQHCQEWVPFIRKLYDRKHIEQIWITGSNSSLIAKEYADLLTGRNIKLPIFPLSFQEFCHFKGLKQLKLPVSKAREGVLLKLFNEYLTVGGFPAIALRTVFQRELLNNYFEDFLYKDIASRHPVKTGKLKDLAIYLATNSGKLFTYRNLAKALDMHTNTIKDYIDYMKDVFLFDELYKFDYSLKKQHSNDKKIFMVDTGLPNTVSFKFSEDKGHNLETMTYLALKRRFSEIYFHRDKKECDFIIKEGTDVTQAIQVTWSMDTPKTRTREIEGLLDAMRIHQLKEGLILTFNQKELIALEGDGLTITVKPLWEWLISQ